MTGFGGRIIVRVIMGGLVLWLGGLAVGANDWRLGPVLAATLVAWLIYLELTLGAPLREGRRLVALRDARRKAAAATAQECRDLSLRVMDDAFQASTVAPGELKITLDTAAEVLENYVKGG